jgi:polygalacturonase
MRTRQNYNLFRRTAGPVWAAAALLAAFTFFGTMSAGAATLCNVNSYGAKGDGITKDTAAIQKAIDACEARGGGTVRLAKGTYLTGPITLKSHITLRIEPGATLLGSQDKADYPDATELRQPGVEPLIEAKNAEDVTTRGGGTIDGNGKPWWDDVYSHRHSADFNPAKRPRLLIFDHCRHVVIEGVTIQNSASWQVVPYYSDHVTIRDGKILAPARSPNTDGIDPFSSHHVLITHMTIDVGDDNVTIKSGQPGSPGPDDPSTDITVRDCNFLHGHGMSIGSELSGGVQHVTVKRVSFENTGNGVRIKSNRDRGGDIGYLDFRDLTMHNVSTAILVTEYYPKIPVHDTLQPVARLTPRFHDIHISNVVATDAKEAGAIVGLPEEPITSIYLNGVHIGAGKGMIVSDATVHAHDFTVKEADGQPVKLLQNAELVKR